MPRGKKSPKTILLIIWLVFSVLYIAFDAAVWTSKTIYQKGQNAALQQAYNTGRGESVKLVIQEAQKCQPFPVNLGDAKVNLIAVECLQAAQQNADAQAAGSDADGEAASE